MVELGAAISVASTSVPWRSSRPLGQQGIHFPEDRLGEPLGFEQVTEVEDGRFIGDRIFAGIDAGKGPHHGHVVQRFFHTGIGQCKPLLHEVDAQHHRQRLGRPATLGADLRVVRFDQRTEPGPRYDTIHLGEERLAAGHFRLLHETRFGKAHLFHRSFRSCRGVLRITHQHRVTSTGFSENPW